MNPKKSSSASSSEQAVQSTSSEIDDLNDSGDDNDAVDEDDDPREELHILGEAQAENEGEPESTAWRLENPELPPQDVPRGRGRPSNEIPNQNYELPDFIEEFGPKVSVIDDIMAENSHTEQTPLAMFMLFFKVDTLSTFIRATNWYGNRFVRGWKDTNMTEIKKFIAIILTMGLVQFPDRDMAFSKGNLGSKFITSLMLKSRFDQLLRAFHFETHDDIFPNMTKPEMKKAKKKQPFWAVKNFSKLLATSFQAVFQCGQGMDIDEQGIPWKGRHKCRCYNPAKPFKWHFKVFALNCSLTGYLHNFYLYEGAAEIRPNDISATIFPFHKLLGPYECYKNKNHVLATDNWYTSVPAANYVTKTIKAEFVGTIKTNKKDLPVNGLFAKKGPSKQPRGAMKQMVNGDGLRLNSWMDNKPVHVLSSLKSTTLECSRHVEMNGKGKGGWVKTTFPQPSIIKIYNKFMGGTDKNDQYISYIRPNLKSMSWVVRVFTHFIIIATVNAYIIYLYLVITEEKRRYYGIRDFTEQLASELAADDNEPITSAELEPSTRGKRNTFWNSSEGKTRRTSGGLIHTPRIIEHGNKKKEHYHESKYGQLCSRYRSSKRSTCRFCSKPSITTMCSHCNIYLCLESKDNEHNCWQKWHQGNDIIGLGSD